MQEYTKIIKVTVLQPMPINDKSWDELPPSQQIGCEEEKFYGAKEYLYYVKFKIKPENYDQKMLERLDYIHRLHQKKTIIKIQFLDPLDGEGMLPQKE